MPSARRRRVQEEESEEELPQTQRRRRAIPSDDSEEEGEEEEEEENDDETNGSGEGVEQLVKKLVRYALACEYQRIPIRKTGISEKVFLKRREPFKKIFELAQDQLRTRFGMAMVELPIREKTTMKEKRDALKKKTNSKPAASYILTTILPVEYRIPEIINPSIIGSSVEEAQYVALCTTIVAVIAMSHSGSIPNTKLESHLRRLNIEKNMPMDTTVNVLKKMAAQQYIFKVVDRSGDEETIDWAVGPRGHIEIGDKGIQRFVKEVYGEKAPEDLEQRLQRSLGLEIAGVGADEEENEAENNGAPGPSTQRKSGRQRQVADDD